MNNKKIGFWALLTIPAITLVIFPLGLQNDIISMSLSVSTLLFGLFVAFSISERLSRIDKIRDNDSSERSSIILMSKVSKLWKSHEQKEIHNLLDEYLIATLDYNIWDYHKTDPQFNRLSDYILELNRDDANKESDFLLDVLAKMLDARERTIGLISDRLSPFEWAVYSVLGSLVIVPFILTNNGGLLSIFLGLALYGSVTLLMTFLYKLDALRWKEEARIFEPYEKAFEAIGAMRYFPEIIIQEGRVANSAVGTYRVGVPVHPYPDMSDKETYIIDAEGKKSKFVQK